MPTVTLQISYDIDPEKREAYLALAKELKNHFGTERKKSYQDMRSKGKKEFLCGRIPLQFDGRI